MLAAAYDGSPEIRVLEREIPRPGPGEFVIKPYACGICGTDLRILRAGHRRIPQGTVRILGHELAGEVVAVGEGVTWPSPGMRVAISPNMGCGHCDLCIRGHTQLCPDYFSFGVVIDGALAECMLVPAAAISQGNVSEIPAHLSYEEAGLNEPLSCCYHGLRVCNIQPEESVLIVGAGPIGLMMLQLARIMGAGRVIMAQRSPGRRQMAERFGADRVINPAEESLATVVRELTGGRGVDVAMIAAPSGLAQAEALSVMAVHGRMNFFGGLPKGEEVTGLDSNLIHYRELTVTGTTGQTIADYRTSLALLSAGRVNVRDLITERFPLAESASAMEYARSKVGLKTVVLPQEAN